MPTETAMKERWCPWVRVSYTEKGPPVNARAGLPRPTCIGSECAMWVWVRHAKEQGDCGLKNQPWLELSPVSGPN